MSKIDTKAILKYLKLNESNISMVLGFIVILILGIIVINYFNSTKKGELQTGISTEQPIESEQGVVKRGDGPVSYSVLKGETLWSISEKQYGTGYNWADISQANNLKNPNIISVGQKLTIPDVEPKAIGVKSGEVKTNSESITSSTYIVKSGDTLWNIAVRSYQNGMDWVKISGANNLVNPNLIHSGNTLKIPR